jgi:thiol-disulfide isomerase/thioredoxin
MTEIQRPPYAPGSKAWVVLAIVVAALLATALWRRLQAAPTGVDSFVLHAQPRELPNLRFSDSNGKTTDLAAQRGRTLLLNVWATWCAPCREEMPTLDRLQAQLGGPHFEVIALSIDKEGAVPVRHFFERNGIRHLVAYLDPSGEASAGLGAVGVPLTVLIGSDGRELARKFGPAAWHDPQMVQLIRTHIPGAAAPTTR